MSKKITNEILEERIEGQKQLINQKLCSIDDKLEQLIEQIKIQNGRVTSLESAKNKLIGISVGVSSAVSFLAKKFL